MATRLNHILRTSLFDAVARQSSMWYMALAQFSRPHLPICRHLRVLISDISSAVIGLKENFLYLSTVDTIFLMTDFSIFV